MSLHDEMEKLRQSHDWLWSATATPAQKEAAREHIEWTAATSTDPKVSAEAKRIRTQYLMEHLV